MRCSRIDWKGGGRSSARETAVRVVAGAIAKQILEKKGVLIQAFTYSVGDMSLTAFPSYIDASLIEKNLVRCPDEVIAAEMIASIEAVKKAGYLKSGDKALQSEFGIFNLALSVG